MEIHVATHITTETVSDTMSHLLTTLTVAASAHQEDIDAIASMAIETSQDLVTSTKQAKQQVLLTHRQIHDLRSGHHAPATVPSTSISLRSAQISTIDIQAKTIKAQDEFTSNVELSTTHQISTDAAIV